MSIKSYLADSTPLDRWISAVSALSLAVTIPATIWSARMLWLSRETYENVLHLNGWVVLCYAVVAFSAAGISFLLGLLPSIFRLDFRTKAARFNMRLSVVAVALPVGVLAVYLGILPLFGVRFPGS